MMKDKLTREPAISLIGTKCVGCESCVQVCPAQALEMKMDAEGFFYPVLDEQRCSRCGLCATACPVVSLERIPKAPLPATAFAGTHTRRDILFSSSSGGAFSVIASVAAPDSVYGTAWTTSNSVGCIRVSPEELAPLRGSKYIQGRVGTAFQQIQQELKAGRKVLFSGTPCQVAGLLTFLATSRCPRDRLITVEIICHGIASPGLFQQYCGLLGRQYHSPVTAFAFREKSPHQSSWDFRTSVTTADGKKRSSTHDLFTRLFLSRLFLRPSCAVCPFSRPERAGDLIIGDYWGCQEHDPELYSKYGVSIILPLTERGRLLIPKLQQAMPLAEVKTENVAAHNLPLTRPSQPDPRRTAFFDLLAQKGASAAFTEFTPRLTWKNRLYPWVKPFLKLLRGR